MADKDNLRVSLLRSSWLDVSFCGLIVVATFTLAPNFAIADTQSKEIAQESESLKEELELMKEEETVGLGV